MTETLRQFSVRTGSGERLVLASLATDSKGRYLIAVRGKVAHVEPDRQTASSLYDAAMRNERARRQAEIEVND